MAVGSRLAFARHIFCTTVGSHKHRHIFTKLKLFFKAIRERVFIEYYVALLQDGCCNRSIVTTSGLNGPLRTCLKPRLYIWWAYLYLLVKRWVSSPFQDVSRCHRMLVTLLLRSSILIFTFFTGIHTKRKYVFGQQVQILKICSCCFIYFSKIGFIENYAIMIFSYRSIESCIATEDTVHSIDSLH